MLTEPALGVGRRAAALKKRLAGIAGLEAALADGESYAGGGALPMNAIPTKLVQMTMRGVAAQEFARRLRAGDPPVIVRIAADAVTLDLRTVHPEETANLAAAIRRAVA